MLDPIIIMFIKRIVTKTLTKIIPIKSAEYSIEQFKEDCRVIFAENGEFVTKVEYLGEDDFPLYILYTDTENWFFYHNNNLIENFVDVNEWLNKE